MAAVGGSNRCTGGTDKPLAGPIVAAPFTASADPAKPSQSSSIGGANRGGAGGLTYPRT